MPAHVRAGLSAGAHALVVWLAAVALNHGIHISPKLSGWLETALLAFVFGGYVWLTHLLSSRKGDGGWPKAARFAGKLLTLGAGALTPAAKTSAPPPKDLVARLAAPARPRRSPDPHDALVQAARQSALRRAGRSEA